MRPSNGRQEETARRADARKAWRVTLATAAACGLVVALEILPSVHARSLASPPLRVALETAVTLIALLAAYLVFGRFRYTGRRSDFVLVFALELIALRTLFFAAYPAVARGDLEHFATWAQVASAVAGAAALAAGAFASDSPVRHRGRVAATLLVLPVVIGGVAMVEAAVIPELPLGVEQAADEPAYVAFQLVAAFFFATAAVGFTLRAGRSGDDLMFWFAAAATIAAFGRLSYALFPPFIDERVYMGDVLRLAFAVVLLVGAAREIQAYWASRAEAAALNERRRVARELHDGLAHELAFIATQARTIATADQDARLARVAAAGERALDEARRAIAALTRPVDEPLDVALTQAAEEVALRAGARVKFELEDGVVASVATREALIRIVREAITNAVRHGHAQTVTVQLAARPKLRLRVVDDGAGFDPAAVRPNGFGLVGMRDRAESLGGSFRAESAPGRGTVIEVSFP